LNAPDTAPFGGGHPENCDRPTIPELCTLHATCAWGALCKWLGRGPAKVVDVVWDLGFFGLQIGEYFILRRQQVPTTRKTFVSSKFAEFNCIKCKSKGNGLDITAGGILTVLQR